MDATSHVIGASHSYIVCAYLHSHIKLAHVPRCYPLALNHNDAAVLFARPLAIYQTEFTTPTECERGASSRNLVIEVDVFALDRP